MDNAMGNFILDKAGGLMNEVERLREVYELTLPRGYKTPIDTTPPISKERMEFDKNHKGVNRNDRCPCGSGLKFKNCCLKNRPN